MMGLYLFGNQTVSIMICKSDSLIKLARTAKIVEIRRGLRMESRSRAGAIFCLRRRSLKNRLRAAPCCGFTSSSAKEPFCQTFSRTASAPPEKLLLQRSQSRSHFQRSQSPAKQTLKCAKEQTSSDVITT